MQRYEIEVLEEDGVTAHDFAKALELVFGVKHAATTPGPNGNPLVFVEIDEEPYRCLSHSFKLWLIDRHGLTKESEAALEKSHRLAIEELKRFTEYVAARSEGNRVLGAGELEAVRISNARIRQILESWI